MNDGLGTKPDEVSPLRLDLEAFDYPLPRELIAQSGVEPRDHARMMVLDRKSGALEDRRVYELPAFLRPGDVVVLNESRVIPARMVARRASGAKLEVLLVRELAPGTWSTLVRPGRRAKVGDWLHFSERLSARVEAILPDGARQLRFEGDVWREMAQIGQTPLPPYIQAAVPSERYQTVYAKRPGSVAAPTAGLHFTPELLARIEALGVQVCRLALHVGPGTFRPVKGSIESHRMHEEHFFIPASTASQVNRAVREGRRVVAVGTTVVRALESAWEGGEVRAGEGQTALFIHPPYEFKVVGALLTNFHLPKSTLLMLVAAFAGYARTMHAYREAVRRRYRFYSLGDAMLIV